MGDDDLNKSFARLQEFDLDDLDDVVACQERWLVDVKRKLKVDDEEAIAAGAVNEVVVLKYAWDSNDHFQVDSAAVPYATWAYWMTLHAAAETEGDIISLAGYQVLPGNVSLWNIKGS